MHKNAKWCRWEQNKRYIHNNKKWINNLIETLNGSSDSDKSIRIAAAQSDIKNADKLQNILTGYKLARLSNVNTENNQRKVEVSNLFRNIKPFKGLNGDFKLWANEIERVSKAKKYSEIEHYYLARYNRRTTKTPCDSIRGRLRKTSQNIKMDKIQRFLKENRFEFSSTLSRILILLVLCILPYYLGLPCFHL